MFSSAGDDDLSEIEFHGCEAGEGLVAVEDECPQRCHDARYGYRRKNWSRRGTDKPPPRLVLDTEQCQPERHNYPQHTQHA